MLRITYKQAKKINRLIRRECCNYDKGCCLLLDYGESCRCVQVISCYGIYCKYFISSVLPIDKQLHKEILQQNQILRRVKDNEKDSKHNHYRC